MPAPWFHLCHLRAVAVNPSVRYDRRIPMRGYDEIRVLAVEDDELERALLNHHLNSSGYRLRMSEDGEEAWSILEHDPDGFDVVLLDNLMPRLSGMELLARMKADARFRLLPVILQTASNSRESMLEGIQAGAYYYLPKPFDPEMVSAVVRTAANDYAGYRAVQESLRRGMHSLSMMQEARFTLRTIEQARDLGSMLATTCPEPETVVVGLTELLYNAIEHGNLGITYDEKTRLDTREKWHAEVARRLAMPENRSKKVEFLFQRREGEISFTIRDEGAGFDWRRFMQIDPRRAFDTHGRGIVVARSFSFSSVEFNERGNEVIARVATRDASPVNGRGIAGDGGA